MRKRFDARLETTNAKRRALFQARLPSRPMGVDSATNDASRVSADVERAARIAARLERAASSVPPRMPLPPTTKLALETVEALFADHGSDLARARCRAEMFCAKRENERVSDLVYGEFGFMALASVLAKHRDAMPETGGVFLDLGSGIGRPLFYAAALAPRAFRDVVGVEIQPGLHELATEVKALYDAEVRPRLGGADAPRVKCLLGDFLSAADEKDCGEENDATRDAVADAWANADLVLVNSCCFGDALFQSVERKAAQVLKKGAIVVTLRRSLVDVFRTSEREGEDNRRGAREVWRLLESAERRHSWGACVAHVHAKVA